MQPYLQLLRTVLDEGVDRTDRTGTGTRSLFGAQLQFDLREGFPAVTTKRLHFKSVVHELLWFLRGETHVGSLQAAGVRIWDEWATAAQTARFGRQEGELGPVYGHQWRNFGATRASDGTYARDGVDQIARVLSQIRDTPDSRRILLSGWNPKEVEMVALPPCHTLVQFYVAQGNLSAHLYQRSGDIFLGVPFNIASYALLTHLLAKAAGLGVARLVHSFGDVHLYRNHFAQAQLQLTRTPRPNPRLRIAGDVGDLRGVQPEQIQLEGYEPHPAIRAEVSV